MKWFIIFRSLFLMFFFILGFIVGYYSALTISYLVYKRHIDHFWDEQKRD